MNRFLGVPWRFSLTMEAQKGLIRKINSLINNSSHTVLHFNVSGHQRIREQREKKLKLLHLSTYILLFKVSKFIDWMQSSHNDQKHIADNNAGYTCGGCLSWDWQPSFFYYCLSELMGINIFLWSKFFFCSSVSNASVLQHLCNGNW